MGLGRGFVGEGDIGLCGGFTGVWGRVGKSREGREERDRDRDGDVRVAESVEVAV
jgi:hypothetical protein